MKLIYHLPDTKEISPFDIEIIEIVKNKVIDIACPYVSYKYIKKIIKLAENFSWLTDINALLSISNSSKLVKLIIENKDKIKHCEGLHSKVIISNDTIFLGSANFTDAGITNNNEVSIRIDEKEKIKELSQWFNKWWNKSIPIIKYIPDIQNYFNIHKKRKNNKNIIINSKSTINCRYVSIKKTKYAIDQKDEEYLINFLKHTNNKYFINYYFDLIKRIIDKFEITVDDRRLCITFIEKNYWIPVTIGQRHVLRYNFNGKIDNIYLIMQKGSKIEDYKQDDLVRVQYYRKKSNDDVPYFRFKKSLNNFKFEETTLLSWELAVENELNRCITSGFRKYHQNILYKFATDIEYRKNILTRL